MESVRPEGGEGSPAEGAGRPEGGRAPGPARTATRAAPGATALAVVAAILLYAPALQAQEDPARGGEARWDVDTWVGLYSPLDDLALMTSEGLMTGVGLGYAVLPRLSLRVEGTFVNLGRTGGRSDLLGGVRGPKAEFWHVTGGFEVELTDPSASGWHVTIATLGGATHQDVGDSEATAAKVGPLQAWVGTANAHGTVGYDASRRLRLVARFGGYVMLGNKEEPESSFLGKEAGMAISTGLRLRL